MPEEYIKRVEIKSNIAAALGPLLFDDMEGVLKWDGDGTGTTWTIEKSSTIARAGTYSLHLKTSTTGAAAYDTLYAERRVSPRPQRKLNFLAHLIGPDTRLSMWMFLKIRYRTGGDLHEAGLRYSYDGTTLDYYNSVAGWTNISTNEVGLALMQVAEIEFTIDTNEKEYISARMNHKEFDLSNIAYKTTNEGTTLSSIEVRLEIQANSDYPVEAYFDDVLLQYKD